MRNYHAWSPAELSFLEENYPAAPKSLLIAKLQNRKWSAINKKAEKLGISRIIQKFNDISPLLEETVEAYYWMGFLIADGSFTPRQLQIAVAKKDLDHLNKFRNFIRSSNEISQVSENYFRLKASSVKEIGMLREKFNIHNNKTKNPSKLPLEKGDLMFAFFIGFFDGDGCLYLGKNRESYTLSIVGDKSWLNNFQKFGQFLVGYFNLTHDTRFAWHAISETSLPQNPEKKKYLLSHFSISKKEFVRAIKRRADELKLPYLERKLGKIT